MNIDHELHDALRRKQAPADFADRVLQRISETPAPSRRPAPSSGDPLRLGFVAHGMRRWLAAAAVLAVAVGGAERYYTQQQAAEAARVKKEIRLALQITNDALARLQTKISQPAENGSR